MKKTIISGRWILFVVLFSFLIIIGILTLKDMIGLSIAMISVGAILIIGYALIIPNRYTFSSEGITIRYGFGLKTFLCWRDVTHIEDHHAGVKGFPWWREYEVAYFKTKIPFHECARISKNKKTTEQLRKYYHKTIETYG